MASSLQKQEKREAQGSKMHISGYNIKRVIKNLIGRLTGHESCVFCGDRENWKPWMERVKSNGYQPPVCIECLSSQKLEAVLHAVNADMSEYNNFCRGFGAGSYYSDAEQEQIMNQVTQAKNNIAGVSGGTINSD